MALNIKLDAEEMETTLVRFIKDYVAATHAQGVVIGVSGGLDSAVVAALAARALGLAHVHGFALPSAVNDPSDLDDARGLADHLGISLDVHEIQPIVDAVTTSLGGDLEPPLVANAMARARMTLLYAEAGRRGCLVLGTGNKSELLTGYFTKHGDGGNDLLPIGDLYKTQVRMLARHLGLPDRIIERPPSAGLWAGQTDEAELGITYERLDQVLLGLEIDLPHERIAEEAGVDVGEVRRIETLRRTSQHKRRASLVCKLGIRTIGTDWRDPVTGSPPEA